MAQNTKNKFYIHDENLATNNNYYTPTEYSSLSERSVGFVAGTTISSKNVNTALRQSSIFTVAFIDALLSNYTSYSSDVIPTGTLDALTTFISTALTKVKVDNASSADSATSATNATHATTADSATNATNATEATHATNADYATDADHADVADEASHAEDARSADYATEAAKVSHTFSITVNGARTTYDGSTTTSLSSFYAPTSGGTSGYVLKSNGSNAPSWISQSSLSVGSASNATDATNATNLKRTSSAACSVHVNSWEEDKIITSTTTGSDTNFSHAFSKTERYIGYKITNHANGSISNETIAITSDNNWYSENIVVNFRYSASTPGKITIQWVCLSVDF